MKIIMCFIIVLFMAGNVIAQDGWLNPNGPAPPAPPSPDRFVPHRSEIDKLNDDMEYRWQIDRMERFMREYRANQEQMRREFEAQDADKVQLRYNYSTGEWWLEDDRGNQYGGNRK